MKRLIASLIVTPLCMAALPSQADVQTYSFHSNTNGSTFEFPGLQLTGQVTGKLKFERNSPNDFPPSNTEFDITKLSFEFENAPNLTAINFQYNPNTASYTSSVNGAWVFKTVNVEVLHINTEAQDFAYRISVETVKDLTGSTFPGPFHTDAILAEGSGYLVNETPFKTVDVANATINGKHLSIKLNGNLSSNHNPENGMIGQGIELKALWFGRGEKVFYVPLPSPDIKPVAIVLDSFSFDGQIEYEYFIRYEEFGNIVETPRQPLQPLLDELFPPL